VLDTFVSDSRRVRSAQRGIEGVAFTGSAKCSATSDTLKSVAHLRSTAWPFFEESDRA